MRKIGAIAGGVLIAVVIVVAAVLEAHGSVRGAAEGNGLIVVVAGMLGLAVLLGLWYGAVLAFWWLLEHAQRVLRRRA